MARKAPIKLPAFIVAHKKSTKRLAEEVGLFAIEFVHLEKQFDHAIGVFLRIPYAGLATILTSAINSVTTRLNILQSLVNGCRMTKRMRAELNMCVVKIRELNTYRNWLLHNSWGGYLPTQRAWQKMRWRVQIKAQRQYATFTHRAIRQKNSRCLRTAVRLSKLVKRYEAYRDAWDERQTSPKKHA